MLRLAVDISRNKPLFDLLLSILNFEAHLKQFEWTSIFSKSLLIFRVKNGQHWYYKEGIVDVSAQIQTKLSVKVFYELNKHELARKSDTYMWMKKGRELHWRILKYKQPQWELRIRCLKTYIGRNVLFWSNFIFGLKLLFQTTLIFTFYCLGMSIIIIWNKGKNQTGLKNFKWKIIKPQYIFNGLHCDYLKELRACIMSCVFNSEEKL